jgi:ankyrin repeat protein
MTNNNKVGNIDDGNEKDDDKTKNILANTVNNLSRRHEALVFLNDKTLTKDEKKTAVMKQNKHGVTALFWAIRRHADHSLIKKMVEIGGKDLVILTNNYGENALINAAFCGSSYDIFKTILDAGGEKLLLQKDMRGNTVMHYSCAWGVSIRTIKYMAEIGGKKSLMRENNSGIVPHSKYKDVQNVLNEKGGYEYSKQVEEQTDDDLPLMGLIRLNKLEQAEIRLDNEENIEELFDVDDSGLNSLMLTLWFVGNSPPDFHNRLLSLVRKMILKGDSEIVLAENNTKSTALHYAAFNGGVPLEIIKLLVETAGQSILQKQNTWGSTPLHDSCFRQAPDEIIEYLVKQGGIEPLKLTNKVGKTPLDILFDADIVSNSSIMTVQREWYELDPHCSRVCSRKIVKNSLEWADSLDPSFVGNNKFMKALLNEGFIMYRYQIIIFADLYAQLGIVLALSPGLITLLSGDQYTFSRSFWGVYMTAMVPIVPILIICVSWFIGREILQIYASTLERYLTYDNFLDFAQILLVCLALREFMKFQDGDVGLSNAGVIISATAIAWIQLLFIIGQLYYSVSLFTYAVVQVSCV